MQQSKIFECFSSSPFIAVQPTVYGYFGYTSAGYGVISDTGLLLPCLCHALQDRTTWGTKLAALKLAQPLVTYFSKALQGAMPALMGATWQLLLAAQV